MKSNKKAHSSYKGTTIYVSVSPCEDNRYCRISIIKEYNNNKYFKSFLIIV